MIVVELNKDELTAAAAVGARRHISALGSENASFPEEGKNWQQHIEGAAAELAVCKHRGHYWVGCGKTSRYDVPCAQVRAIMQKNHSLILRERDESEDAYILVFARAPLYVLLGWLNGYEGMQDEYLTTNDKDPKPYWQIPQEILRAMP